MGGPLRWPPICYITAKRRPVLSALCQQQPASMRRQHSMLAQQSMLDAMAAEAATSKAAAADSLIRVRFIMYSFID
jgi:hypothetical protein